MGTGLSTHVLFPALVLAVLVGAIAGGGEVLSAVAASARGEDVNLLLPAVGATFCLFSLAVIGYGLALAPKPQPQPEVVEAAE